MNSPKTLNLWEYILINLRSHPTLIYLCLLPPLYLLNSHHGPLKGFFVGCAVLSFGLWKMGQMREVSTIISFAWLSLLYTFGVVLVSFASDLREPEAFRYFYKILFLSGFIGLSYEVVKRYGVQPFLLSLKICTLVAAIVSLLAFKMEWSSQALDRLAPIGLLYHPILGASVYGMVGVMSCYRMLISIQTRQILFNGAIVALSFLVILSCLSRGPLVAYAAGILMVVGYFLFLQPQKISHKAHVVLWLGGISALIFIVLMNYRTQGVLWSSIWERGDSYRFYIWKEICKHIKNNIFWGVGYKAEIWIPLSNNSSVNHPHNLFLSKFYREGLVGFSFLLVLMGLCGHKIMKVWRSEEGGLASILFVHGVLSCLTDTSAYWDGKNFEMFLFFWFPIIFLAGVKDDRCKINTAQQT